MVMRVLSKRESSFLIDPFDDGFLVGYLNRAGVAFDFDSIPRLTGIFAQELKNA